MFSVRLGAFWTQFTDNFTSPATKYQGRSNKSLCLTPRQEIPCTRRLQSGSDSAFELVWTTREVAGKPA